MAVGAPQAGAATPPIVTPPKGVAPLKPGAAPGLAPVKITKHITPVPFKLGACGPGQTQCFTTGGKVGTLAADSPANMRMKSCAFASDPFFGCGSCERCLLMHTEGANCSSGKCDYKNCEKDWADEDGDRKNGCERYRAQKPPMPAGAKCKTDADCAYLGANDGLFLHPHGECKPGAQADSRGCQFFAPNCQPWMRPDENMRSCVWDYKAAKADTDGDGFVRPDPAHWLGDDCDDGDPTSFPGNAEQCDTFNHDEDCNPHTNGGADRDGDTLTENTCCNVQANGTKYCGTDCDDAHDALATGAQRCDPAANGKAQTCNVDRSGGGQVATWVTQACPAGTTCRPQPSGTGTCQ
jgi:hypothetical protein